MRYKNIILNSIRNLSYTSKGNNNKKSNITSTLLYTGTAISMFIIGDKVYNNGQNITKSLNYLSEPILMPFLRSLDPELSHKLSILSCSYGITPKDLYQDDPILATTVFNKYFINPFGMAAGFDKNGEAITGILDIGFGFLEIGSVTPEPQEGNPKPRNFRLVQDKAVINRYGFNSDGQDIVAKRLESYRNNFIDNNKLIGINLGKNKNTIDSASDYVKGIEKLGRYADYLVINISSPNTPGLRNLQGKKLLENLISDVLEAKKKLEKDINSKHIPLLIKIAPDLNGNDLKDIADVILKKKLDGIIISNTTVSRPAHLKDIQKDEMGGLSGVPLKEKSLKLVSDMYKLTKGKVPIIGVGGISNGKDAFEFICAGASLVQLYTALVYSGPEVIGKSKKELALLLKEKNFKSIQEAVGSANKI